MARRHIPSGSGGLAVSAKRAGQWPAPSSRSSRSPLLDGPASMGRRLLTTAPASIVHSRKHSQSREGRNERAVRPRWGGPFGLPPRRGISASPCRRASCRPRSTCRRGCACASHAHCIGVPLALHRQPLIWPSEPKKADYVGSSNSRSRVTPSVTTSHTTDVSVRAGPRPIGKPTPATVAMQWSFSQS